MVHERRARQALRDAENAGITIVPEGAAGEPVRRHIKTPDSLLRAYANTVDIETFTIAPIMLKDIEAKPID